MDKKTIKLDHTGEWIPNRKVFKLSVKDKDAIGISHFKSNRLILEMYGTVGFDSASIANGAISKMINTVQDEDSKQEN